MNNPNSDLYFKTLVATGMACILAGYMFVMTMLAHVVYNGTDMKVLKESEFGLVYREFVLGEDLLEPEYGAACDIVTEDNWKHPHFAQAKKMLDTYQQTWASRTARERCKWTLDRSRYSTEPIQRVIPCIHGGVAKGCAIYKEGSPLKMKITDPFGGHGKTVRIKVSTDEDMARIKPHLVLLE